MKSSVYPTVIVVALGLVGLVLASQFSVTIEQVEPEPPLVTTPAPRSTTPTPAPTTKPSTTARVPGGLRMRNQTDQPVRVALLAKSSSGEREPAHWDFAPQEGSTQGLILSLPEGTLKLNKGDVLVGFAQDGSGRYWGSYIVGETAAPVWNKHQEWELTLK